MKGGAVSGDRGIPLVSHGHWIHASITTAGGTITIIVQSICEERMVCKHSTKVFGIAHK